MHTGWWTDDGRYLYVNDELDERDLGLNTTIRIFDMADLRAPALVGSWVGPTGAIDHNTYVKGNRLYFANYSEGLTILDITNPVTPVRIGYFDTWPANSQTAFVGAWGVYPFFASGTIAVSDINSGLYLLHNETLASPGGAFRVVDDRMAGSEGQSLCDRRDSQWRCHRRGVGAARGVVCDCDGGGCNARLDDVQLGRRRRDTQVHDAESRVGRPGRGSGAADDPAGRSARRREHRLSGHHSSGHQRHRQRGARRVLDEQPIVDEARAKAYVTLTRRGSANGEVRASYRTVAGGTYGGATAAQGFVVWPGGDVSAKTVTVALDPATLGAGQSGTFRMEIFDATNASLETNAGASVAVLPVTVTVRDFATAPTPPTTPPPAAPPRNSGGGGIDLLLLLALGLLTLVRRGPANRLRPLER